MVRLLGPMGPVFKQPWVALGQASHGKGDERDQGRSDARNPQRLPGKTWVKHPFCIPDHIIKIKMAGFFLFMNNYSSPEKKNWVLIIGP